MGVFNVPKDYLDEHPGGLDVIVALGGKDASQDFEDSGHGEDSRRICDRYIIGVIEGPEGDAAKKRGRMPLESELKEQNASGESSVLWSAVVVAGLAALAGGAFLAKRM